MAKGKKGVFLPLAALALLGYCGYNASPQSRPSRPWVPGMQDVRAATILDAFAENEAAAERAFDRPIQIIGIVASIDAGGGDSVDLAMTDVGRSDIIPVIETADQGAAILTLKTGGPIRVQCLNVMEVLSIISAQNCLVQPSGG